MITPTISRIFAVALSSLLLVGGNVHAAEDRFAVHEWGTFTSLQDEEGNTLGGINTDDEPVPRFVHDISRGLILHPALNTTGIILSKGIGVAACHRDVTMRLETPVLYIHAPASFTGKIGVTVSFRGGWLSQFFPKADFDAPGVDRNTGKAGRLPPGTEGWLHWPEVQLAGEDRKGPHTQDRVWLAPRAVKARMLQVGEEYERFLFYRGVGNLDAPLRVVRKGSMLNILPRGDWAVRKLWLVDIKPDGSGAFRTVEVSDKGAEAAFLASTPASFKPKEYSADALVGLRQAMKAALIEEGLFADEAEGLLNTWEVSYFKSVGLRLFFMTPTAWTDAILPLEITGMPKETEIKRAIVGRIELVSPEQRQAIRRLNDLARLGGGASQQAMKAYKEMGRFARPLIINEIERNPTPGLQEFAAKHQLATYPPR